MAEALIRFGGTDAEYLMLTVHGRNIPEAADYWDGNFLWCPAEVAAGAFRGSFSNLIRNEDLARFLPRLETLYERLDGVALFDTLDGWLDVQVVGVGRGHIEVRGQFIDDPWAATSWSSGWPSTRRTCQRLSLRCVRRWRRSRW